jgi:hypothetical protein
MYSRNAFALAFARWGGCTARRDYGPGVLYPRIILPQHQSPPRFQQGGAKAATRQARSEPPSAASSSDAFSRLILLADYVIGTVISGNPGTNGFARMSC